MKLDQQLRQVTQGPDGRRIGEPLGEVALQGAQVGLQGPYSAIELALGAEVREVLAQVRGSKTPKVPLAAEARPLGQFNRQGDDLWVREQGGTTRAARGRTTASLPPLLISRLRTRTITSPNT